MPLRTHQPRGVALVAALVAGLLVSALVAWPVSAQDSDPKAERARVRAQRAEVASQLDTLQATDDQVQQALRDLDENLRAAQGELADARRQAAEAVQRAFDSQAAADQKAKEVEELQQEMAALAVESYVNPPGHDWLDRLRATSATEAAEKEALLEAHTRGASDVLDQLRRARADLDRDRRDAEQAKQDADQRASDAEARMTDYQQALAQQQALAVGLDERINARLSEAESLAAVDADLSAQIVAQQAALAASVPRPTPVATPPGTPPPTTPAPPGTPPGTPPGNPPPPPTPPRPVPPPPPLKTVRGITVNAAIAAQLEAMLAAAAADGIILGGSGYRDINAQIALRRAHCGPSDYEIYEMPAMLCTPPTAIPGTSMHEQGLAVDFTYGGLAISTRDSPAWKWLDANAGRYGFINLPSEPWHWSVTGR